MVAGSTLGHNAALRPTNIRAPAGTDHLCSDVMNSPPIVWVPSPLSPSQKCTNDAQLRTRLSRIQELLRWESSNCLIEVKSVSVRLLYLDEPLLSDSERSRAIVTVHVAEGSLMSLVNNHLQLIDQYVPLYDVMGYPP